MPPGLRQVPKPGFPAPDTSCANLQQKLCPCSGMLIHAPLQRFLLRPSRACLHMLRRAGAQKEVTQTGENSENEASEQSQSRNRVNTRAQAKAGSQKQTSHDFHKPPVAMCHDPLVALTFALRTKAACNAHPSRPQSIG